MILPAFELILYGCKKQATKLALLLQARIFHVCKPVSVVIILTIICFSIFFLYMFSFFRRSFLNISVLNCLTQNTVFILVDPINQVYQLPFSAWGGLYYFCPLPKFCPCIFFLFNPMVNFLVAFCKPFFLRKGA